MKHHARGSRPPISANRFAAGRAHRALVGLIGKPRATGRERAGSAAVLEHQENDAALLRAVHEHASIIVAALLLVSATKADLLESDAKDAALFRALEAAYPFYGRPGNDGQHLRQACEKLLARSRRDIEPEPTCAEAGHPEKTI